MDDHLRAVLGDQANEVACSTPHPLAWILAIGNDPFVKVHLVIEKGWSQFLDVWALDTARKSNDWNIDVMPRLLLVLKDLADITNGHIEHLVSDYLWKKSKTLGACGREAVVCFILLDCVVMLEVESCHQEALEEQIG